MPKTERLYVQLLMQCMIFVKNIKDFNALLTEGVGRISGQDTFVIPIHIKHLKQSVVGFFRLLTPNPKVNIIYP